MVDGRGLAGALLSLSGGPRVPYTTRCGTPAPGSLWKAGLSLRTQTVLFSLGVWAILLDYPLGPRSTANCQQLPTEICPLTDTLSPPTAATEVQTAIG